MRYAHSNRMSRDGDILLVAIIAAVLAAMSVVVSLLALSAAIATSLSGGSWQLPGWLGCWRLAAAVVTDPADPGAHLAQPWSTLAGRPVLYWSTTAVLVTVILGGVGMTGRALWRRWGFTAPGHATRREIRKMLSPARARTTARWTRAALDGRARREASLDEIAVPLHRGPHKEPLCTTLETPTGTVAPTRSGKTRRDLIHKVLAAPGALLASTTKPDLAEWGLLARNRRAGAGPVWLCDATGSVTWPNVLRWSPILGCHELAVALRRADALVEASALGLKDIAGNDKVFRERAKSVVQSYLLAAAMDNKTVADIVAWAITKPPDQEPVEILRAHGYSDLASNLRAEIGMVAETSDAVWLSVRRCLEPFMNPFLRELCTPGRSEHFDVTQFVLERGALFLIAGEYQAPHARPVLTALVDHILTTAQDLALHQPSRRLDPPLEAILDELYDATPVSRLPGTLADSAGRGVLIHWGAQSVGQLEELYGVPGRRQLLDNTLTLTVFPGIKDDETLRWLSTLAGHHRRRTIQQHNESLFAAGRSAIGTETIPTYRPGDIRTLPDDRVLIIHGNLRPILGRTVDVEARPDWPQLKADVQAIRAGSARLDDHSHQEQ